MSVFVCELNRVTGQQEWVVKSDDYDYQQEIARYALHLWILSISIGNA